MDLEFSRILILIRISALVAVREKSQLIAELKKALRKKLQPALIREAILQSYLFAGYASAINAFIVFNQLVPEDSRFLLEKEASLRQWDARGKRLCLKIYGMHYKKLVRNMKRLHPELAEWMIWEGYGKVLSRPFLSPRIRELIIVGMTAVLEVERQFHSHVMGAMNVGATAQEVQAAFQEIKRFIPPKARKKFQRLLDELTL